MIINLEEIFLHGKPLKIDHYPINIDVQDLPRQDIKNCKAEACVSIEKVMSDVYLEAEVNLAFDCLCDNCVESIKKNLSFSFKHLPVVKEEADSDVDCISVKDYKLDLDSLIIEDIILEFPSKILCSNDCLGLCLKCGKNLNHGDCGCAKKSVDPRLEALKSWLY